MKPLFILALLSLIAFAKCDFEEETLEVELVPGESAKKFNIVYEKDLQHLQDEGPIFVVIGRKAYEDKKNRAFFLELAKNNNGGVIFMPRRFESDKSAPTGDYTKNGDQMKTLTIKNILNDFVALAKKFKNSKFVAIGSGNDGLFATWLHLLHSDYYKFVWASSAPLFLFDDVKSPDLEYATVGKNILKLYEQNGCLINEIRKGITDLKSAEVDTINSIFDVKQKVTTMGSIKLLTDFIHLKLQEIAEQNYPFKYNNHEEFPLKVFCTKFNENPKESILKRLNDALTTYVSEQINIIPKDYDVETTVDLYLKCTQLVFTYRPSILDAPSADDSQATWRNELKEFCKRQSPLIATTETLFKISAVKDLNLDYSNIKNAVFTNGEKNPFAEGSITPSFGAPKKDNVFLITMEKASSGIDQVQPNTCDYNTVTVARHKVFKIFACWTQKTDCDDLKEPEFNTHVAYQQGNTDDCEESTEGYPWAVNVPGGPASKPPPPGNKNPNPPRPKPTATTQAPSTSYSESHVINVGVFFSSLFISWIIL